MRTGEMFWSITWRTLSGLVAASCVTQLVFAALFGCFGVVGALVNGQKTLVGGVGTLLGVFFLNLVGAVLAGLFTIPASIFLGCSGGILLSLITRLFFYPLRNVTTYRNTMRAALMLYVIGGGWLSFMAVYLLFARNHKIHSPRVFWLALGGALVAGLISLPVSQWASNWYESQQAQKPNALHISH